MATRADPGPGLPRLDVAVDTQPGFLANMRRAIGRRVELGGLTTRDADDPSITLLDAAATVLDVLSFYCERIANESYLRTATERLSIDELARAIGYELGPGVAASTKLAFNVDPPPGTPDDVVVPAGTAAQKVPGADGRSAAYETTADIVARKELNELRLRQLVPTVPALGDDVLHLAGIGHGLSAGSLVLLVGDERLANPASEAWDVRTVIRIEELPAVVGLGADGTPDRTVVTLDRGIGHHTPHIQPAATNVRCYHLPVRCALFGHTALRHDDLPISLRVGELNPDPSSTTRFLPGPYKDAKSTWVDVDFATGTTELFLERIVPEITAGSWIVLSRAGYRELYLVTETEEDNQAAFLQSGPSTRVAISGENIDLFSIRTTTVFGGARELRLGGRPIAGPITGTDLVVDTVVTIEHGREVIVTGTDDASGLPVAEAIVVDATATDTPAGIAPGTRVTFVTALRHAYRPAGLRVRGNVAPATHGQRVRELPLGSGDAGRGQLSFTLAVGDPSPGPLTYVASDAPSGRTSTLEVRVDGVLWEQVPTLYGQPPDARVYTVRHTEHAGAIITFGDGVSGARPASGRDNVTATYRVGLGSAGTADPKQISVPLTLPLGVREVINPIVASGSEDPEPIDRARINAPATVRTLNRIVSLADFEDFARTFAGIGWAAAAELDDGRRAFVHLTVARADGSPLVVDSDTGIRLRDAIARVRHADRRLVLHGHTPRPVAVAAAVRIDPAYRAADVLAAATSAVTELFDRDRSGFGALLTPTIVHGTLHGMAGVTGVVLSRLRDDATGGPLVQEVLARPARVVGATVRTTLPAELLVPGTITISEAGPP
jgi:predicted phage baseplate assembly protein